MKKFFSFIWEFLKIAVVVTIIVMPIRYFIFQPFFVKGESMEQTFKNNDYLIVDEISYRFRNPKRGEVIVFKYPKDPSQDFIKRVIGLPGETVRIKNEKVEIFKDGKKLILNESKYLSPGEITLGDVNVSLKKNEYFVMGDNRLFSYDSRRFGVVPRKDIIGVVVLRLFHWQDKFPFISFGSTKRIVAPVY